LDSLIALLPQLPTLEEIIVWGGYVGLFVIIFAETGLLIGFFLPGDSLLVTAGLFAYRNPELLDIWWLNILLIIAAITGDAVGYNIGLRGGRPLFDRPQSRWFRKDHLLKTQAFYEKYGGVTIIMARFMPFARTFAPVVAGVANMKYRRFALFNFTGGIGWIVSMTLLGYFLGVAFPDVVKHIELVIIAIVFLSVLPLIIKYVQHKFKKAPLVEEEV
jgi:membrane-associated protein